MATLLLRQRPSVGVKSNRLVPHSRTDEDLEQTAASSREVRHIADRDECTTYNGEQQQLGHPPAQRANPDAIPPDAHLSPQHIAVSFQAQSAIPTLHP